MVGEAGFEVTSEMPICGLCGKKYDVEKAEDNGFCQDNFFYGTLLYSNKKNWLGKTKKIRVEFCHDCMKVVELIRKGAKVGLIE